MKFLVLSMALFAMASAQTLPSTDPIHLPGGLHKIAVDDARLVDVLSHVQTDLNARMNSMNYYKVGKVIEASTQVVSGIMYHVTFEFGATQCLKSKVTAENLAQCTGFSEVQICNVRFLSQPWLHHTETTSFHCEAKVPVVQPSIPVGQFYADIAGGKQKLDLNDATLAETLSAVLPQINDKLDSTYFHRMGKVLEAESQIVSGILYHVTFELGQTQCQKEKVAKENLLNKNTLTRVLAECNEFSHVQTCTAKIWSQPWLQHIEATEVHCEARKPDMHIPGDIRGPTIPL